jgi:drug/metabolite transporter (DMT)-like permease
VVIFALTLPMTRLAVGPAEAPQLPPLFVTAGRAALATLPSIVFLWATRATRAPWPPRRLWPALGVSAAGTVVGFPLFIALALRDVPAMHAAVVTGLLPLATAALAAWAFGQRPSAGFWVCAGVGSGLVLAFAAVAGGGALSLADGLLVLAVLSGAVGYVAGAVATREMPAPRVICWVLVASLPLTAPLMLASWPTRAASAAAWGGFAYVTLFSMWLGFFAWYRALALGGAVRVSQVQLLQPFLSLLFAVPILGERLDATILVFALAVAATVFIGRRLPADTPARAA